MSGPVFPLPGPAAGSLLLADTDNDPATIPDTELSADTVATWTSRWFGGHSVHPAPGRPVIVGPLLSSRAPHRMEVGSTEARRAFPAGWVRLTLMLSRQILPAMSDTAPAEPG